MKLVSKSYPQTHLLNPARAYIPAAQTDVRATFERIRAEQAQQPQKKVRRVK